MSFRAMPKKIPGFGAGPYAPVQFRQRSQIGQKIAIS